VTVVSVDFNKELNVALILLLTISTVQLPPAFVAFLQVDSAALFLNKFLYF